MKVNWVFTKHFKNTVALVAFALPLSPNKEWVELKFNKIPPNSVKFQDGLIQVEVKSSASPLVFKLPQELKVKSFSFDLQVDGKMKQAANSTFEEDAFFRLGLVAVGTKTLGRMQKMIAADWVKKLFDLSPPGSGIDKIYFFNVASDEKFKGQQRIHPKSDLMSEQVIGVATGALMTHYKYELPSALPTVALWISIDGDDSQSDFQVKLKNLTLTH